MTRTEPGLLTIGDVARGTRLSVKALRLYDQLGLFTPAYTDPESGYRYYRVDQVRTARLIRSLRQVEMPLALIRRVLAAPAAEAEGLLRDHQQTLEARAARARRMVPALVRELRKEEGAMSLEVNVRELSPQPVVSVTRPVKVGDLDRHIRDTVATLNGFVTDHGGGAAGAPFGLYHGQINEEDDGPIEVCLPVRDALTGDGEIAAKELPGGRFAYVTLRGDECEFPAILRGYDAVHDWIEANGYTAADSPRETWRTSSNEDGGEMEVGWRFRDPAGA